MDFSSSIRSLFDIAPYFILTSHLKVKVKVTQLCTSLCNPMDYTVHGILQARILDGVAIPFSRGCSQPRDKTQVSHIAGRFLTSWVTRKGQEYWSGLPCPPSGAPPNPGIEPRFPSLQVIIIWAAWEAEEHWSSLSLLQGNFLTQESNWGLMHYRWILYQLSYQESPRK